MPSPSIVAEVLAALSANASTDTVHITYAVPGAACGYYVDDDTGAEWRWQCSDVSGAALTSWTKLHSGVGA